MNLSSTLTAFPVSRVGRRLVALFLIAFVASSAGYLFARRAHAWAFSFEGFNETANCSVISGWAWDANQPNTPINVDIYGDNVLLSTVPADIFRQDLADAGKGNGIHGFSFTTPDSLKDGQPHSILVRISGSNINLSNSPKTINCSIAVFQGVHERTDCSMIVGWAWDANQPNTPINVDVYFDNNSFVSVRAPANQFRQDLLDAGFGNGAHGFSFATPAALKNGQPHTVTIKFTGTNTPLSNTVQMLTCGQSPPVFEGFHEVADCTTISGWAWDANQPNTPISVDIYNGGTVIATVVANQFRQDLLNAGKGNGVHGFSFFVPNSLKNGQPHTISVGFTGTLTALFNTPKTINCPPPAGPVYQGFHDTANCDTISGWAWDSTQPNTPINVDIYSDGNLVMTVAADQFRQDLANAGVGNGFHAFSFTVPNGLKDGQPHSISVKFGGTGTTLNGTPKTITCSP